MGGVDEFCDLGGEVGGVGVLVGGGLGLEEFVEEGDDVAVDVVGPEAACRSGLGVEGEEGGAGGEVFEVFHYHAGFVCGPRGAVADGGDEAARVDVE